MLAKRRLAQLTGVSLKAPTARAGADVSVVGPVFEGARVVVYCDAQRQPVYVSEPASLGSLPGIVEFADIDLSGPEVLPAVARSNTLFVRVWVPSGASARGTPTATNGDRPVADTPAPEHENRPNRTAGSPEERELWKLDISQTLDLNNLIRVPQKHSNSLIILRFDTLELVAPGHIVTHRESRTGTPESSLEPLLAPVSKPDLELVPSPPQSNGSNSRPLTTVTSLAYDTLVKIWTLQRVLDDSKESTKKVHAIMNEMVPRSAPIFRALIKELQMERAKITQALEQTHKLERDLRKKTNDKQIKAAKRVSELTASLEDTKTSTNELSQEGTTGRRRAAKEVSALIEYEQGRLGKQLMEIFPIAPVDASFHFSICGLRLPSVFGLDQYDPAQVGAALGLVAQVVLALSKYLDTPLPYPVQPYGSQSFVMDEISNIKGSRIFPLWTKGALLYRVEYGLYLLHRDIERLMAARGLRVADLKQTLANLQNLLLVMSTK